MVAVLRGPGEAIGRATLWVKLRGELSHRVVCDASVPSLPGIRTETVFQF
jgi:hypothetical protein